MKNAPWWIRHQAVRTGLNGFYAQQLADQLAALASVVDPDRHPCSAVAWKPEDIAQVLGLKLQIERASRFCEQAIQRMSAGLLDRPRLSDGAS